MKKVIACLLLAAFTISAISQKIKLWGDHPESRKMRYSELTPFPVPPDENTGISVIICPGGSYCYLGMNVEGYKVAEWLNKKGINAFVLRYRTGIWGNHHPAMIQDLQRSIEWVREHSREYDGKVNKIGVMGFSAGGHLAGTSAIYYDENFMKPLGIDPAVSLRPDFVAMIYPVVSMQDSLVHRKSRRNLLTRRYSPELAHKMSLEENVHEGMPPVFLVHCEDDGTVDVRNSKAFSARMITQGLACQTYIYKRGDHGFGIAPPKTADANEWTGAFEEWINEIAQ